MDRRRFIHYTTAVMLVPPSAFIARARADGGHIRHMDRAVHEVWFSRDVQKFTVRGWKIELNQDLQWDLFGWNPGPKGVKYWIAKPAHGDWEKLDEMYVGPGESHKLIKRWTPDNEDLLFWAGFENSAVGGGYEFADGTASNSNARTLDGNLGVHMSWNRPQELHLQIEKSP